MSKKLDACFLLASEAVSDDVKIATVKEWLLTWQSQAMAYNKLERLLNAVFDAGMIGVTRDSLVEVICAEFYFLGTKEQASELSKKIQKLLVEYLEGCLLKQVARVDFFTIIYGEVKVSYMYKELSISISDTNRLLAKREN